MRIRRRVKVSNGKNTERVALQVDLAEIKSVLGQEPTQNPKMFIHVEHGLLRVRAAVPSDDANSVFSMWRVSQRATPMWESQLHPRHFVGVRLSAYEDITDLATRKAGRELHAQLDMLSEGEVLAPPTRKLARRAPSAAPKEPAAVDAASTEGFQKLVPQELFKNTQLEPSQPPALADRINQQYGVSDTDRSILKAALAYINDQIRRGGVRPTIGDNGEVSLQVMRIRVETESL